MAYFSIINFFGGVESGLIWLKTGGFLKFYSGNTEGAAAGAVFAVLSGLWAVCAFGL